MVMRLDGYIEERIEQLFISEEHKVFFLTGQQNGNGRRAFIKAKSFDALDDVDRGILASQAIAWTKEDNNMVQITTSASMLSFRDDCTGTQTNVSRASLALATAQTFRSDPFVKFIGDATTTGKPISVSKPLTLKKPGLTL